MWRTWGPWFFPRRVLILHPRLTHRATNLSDTCNLLLSCDPLVCSKVQRYTNSLLHSLYTPVGGNTATANYHRCCLRVLWYGGFYFVCDIHLCNEVFVAQRYDFECNFCVSPPLLGRTGRGGNQSYSSLEYCGRGDTETHIYIYIYMCIYIYIYIILIVGSERFSASGKQHSNKPKQSNKHISQHIIHTSTITSFSASGDFKIASNMGFPFRFHAPFRAPDVSYPGGGASVHYC